MCSQQRWRRRAPRSGSKPDSASAHDNLGGALRDEGHPDEAIASCHRKAVELDPKNANGHNNLGNGTA